MSEGIEREKTIPRTGERVISYDDIRIVATFAVIMIHISAEYVTGAIHTTAFAVGNVFDSLSRIGVPLFVMITGALLLDEKKNITFRKAFTYAIRMAGLLAFWSLLYAVIFQIVIPHAEHRDISLHALLQSFVSGHFHLWYLHMLIGFYLVLPIMRVFVKRENKRIVEYVILLSVVFQFCVPLANYACDALLDTQGLLKGFAGSLRLNLVEQYTAYFLFGWYLANFGLKKKFRILLYLSCLLGLLVAIVGTQLLITESNVIYNMLYNNLSINIFLYSTAVFTALFYAFRDRRQGRSGWLVALSGLTFGMYLIHPLILHFLAPYMQGGNPFLRLLAVWLTVTAASFLFSFLLSHIPVIKKLIRC